MIFENYVAVPTATAIFSAGADVFESNSEVRQLIFDCTFIEDINNLLTCISRLLLVPEFAATLVLQELRSALRLHFQMESL